MGMTYGAGVAIPFKIATQCVGRSIVLHDLGIEVYTEIVAGTAGGVAIGTVFTIFAVGSGRAALDLLGAG